jgi:hypothetical protein
VGKSRALYARHELLVAELARRGYRHHSPLEAALASGSATQDVLLDSLADQLALLADKPCPCLLWPDDPRRAAALST